ncbi:hypothetical protein FRC07_013728, partial [Ceratobasidium sp. 392]
AVDELADADLQNLETYLRRSKLKSTASATATPASLILYAILIPGAIVAVPFCVWGSIHRREVALKKHNIVLQQLEERELKPHAHGFIRDGVVPVLKGVVGAALDAA